MKRKVLIGALVAVLALAAASIGLAQMIEDDQNPGTWYAVIADPPPGSGCVCPTVFAPVICDYGSEKRAYSNACIAACRGATNCRQIVWQ